MITISSLLSFYITYDRLNKIINDNFKTSNKSYDKCNIFIDLSSGLNSLYYNKVYMKNNENLNIDILKDILNMISHYKLGLKNYNVSINFYFIYSDNNSKVSINYYPYYNTNMKLIKSNNSMITDNIRSSLNLFKKIWKFLYNVFYIESDNDSSHIIYKLLKDKTLNDELNMIITKDPVIYQDIYQENILILRPFKDIKEKKDTSYIINNNNKLDYFIKSYNISKTINDFNIEFDINRNIISSIMSLSGIKQRSYNKIFKISESIEILNNYCSMYNTRNIIPLDLFKMFKENKLSYELENRWKAIDSDYNYNTINDIFDYDIKRLVDRDFLYNLNEKYFNNEVKIDEISN